MKKEMLPDWLEKIEFFVDRAVPYVLVFLAVLIILEFLHVADQYHDLFVAFDYFIVSFFVVDLCFKWYHTRNVLKFIKLYWIDLIAVFPFYTAFRVYFAATELFAAGESAQKILHEAVLLRETRLLKEAELLREAEYGAKFAKEGRFVRVIARSLRILRARWYVAHWHLHNVSRGYKQHHK
jgi:hypothetical protein